MSAEDIPAGGLMETVVVGGYCVGMVPALVESRLSRGPERFDGDHRATWRYIAERYGSVVVGRDEVWR
jgi:hypothetical protein